MSKGSSRAIVVACAAVGSACSLLTDLTGFDDGAHGVVYVEPSRQDAGPDHVLDATVVAQDGAAPDAGPYHPKYERAVTLTNRASVELPAASTQCFFFPAGSLQSKARPDLGDVRIFGPTTERARSLDVRGAGHLSVCFSLERAVAPGGADTYHVRYGDPDAVGPPAVERELFAFWEPFDGAAIDTGRWLVNGTAVVSDGTMTLPGGAANAIATRAGQDDVPAAASLEIRARVTNPASAGGAPTGETFFYWFGFQRRGDFTATEPWALFIGRAPGAIRAELKTEGASGPCGAVCTSLTSTQTTDFRVYRIDRGPTKTTFIDDTATPYTADGTNGDESVMIRNFLTDGDLIVDWVRARPAVAPEPTVELGGEEALP